MTIPDFSITAPDSKSNYVNFVIPDFLTPMRKKPEEIAQRILPPIQSAIPPSRGYLHKQVIYIPGGSAKGVVANVFVESTRLASKVAESIYEKFDAREKAATLPEKYQNIFNQILQSAKFKTSQKEINKNRHRFVIQKLIQDELDAAIAASQGDLHKTDIHKALEKALQKVKQYCDDVFVEAGTRKISVRRRGQAQPVIAKAQETPKQPQPMEVEPQVPVVIKQPEKPVAMVQEARVKEPEQKRLKTAPAPFEPAQAIVVEKPSAEPAPMVVEKKPQEAQPVMKEVQAEPQPSGQKRKLEEMPSVPVAVQPQPQPEPAPVNIEEITSQFVGANNLKELVWDIAEDAITHRTCYFLQSNADPLKWNVVKIFPDGKSKEELIAALGGQQKVDALGINFLEKNNKVYGLTFTKSPVEIVRTGFDEPWWQPLAAGEMVSLYTNLSEAIGTAMPRFSEDWKEAREKCSAMPQALKESLSQETLAKEVLDSQNRVIGDITTIQDLKQYEEILRNPFLPPRFVREIFAKTKQYSETGSDNALKAICTIMSTPQAEDVEITSDRARQILHIATLFALYKDNPNKIAEEINHNDYYDDLVPGILEKMNTIPAFANVKAGFDALEHVPLLSDYEKLRMAITKNYVIPQCAQRALAQYSEVTSKEVPELPGQTRVWKENTTVITSKKLGEGGLKIVHAAIEHIPQGASYAPVLRAHLEIKPGQWPKPMFENQEVVLKKLSQLSADPNSHIIRMPTVRYDQAAEKLCFTAEYCTEDLSKRPAPGNLEELHQNVQLFRDFMIGLGTMHANNIVHLDVKPPNMLLKSTVDPITQEVTQVGLATDFDTSCLLDPITQKVPEAIEKLLIGKGTTPTAVYTPPEGAKISRETDIWQAGLSLLTLMGEPNLSTSETLNEEKIPTGENFVDAIKNSITDPLEDLQTITQNSENANLQGARLVLFAMLSKILVLDPTKRPKAQAIEKDLTDFLNTSQTAAAYIPLANRILGRP